MELGRTSFLIAPRASRLKSNDPNALKNGVEEDILLPKLSAFPQPTKYILNQPHLSAIHTCPRSTTIDHVLETASFSTQKAISNL